MAHDAAIIAERNAKILAEYNRLKSEEKPIKFLGKTYYTKLMTEQVLKILGARYYLSPRSVENIIFYNEPKAAPLKSAPPTLLPSP